MSGDRLLDGLNTSQQHAVTASGGPVVVLAGAGSGKTRVLTRRIAYRVLEGDTDPRRVLALTFTRKAASELRQRLSQLGLRDNVVAGTFHAVALTQLRQRWLENRITPPTILDRKYRLISQLTPKVKGVEPMDVVAEVEWARARMVEPQDYPAAAELSGRTPPLAAADMVRILAQYQQEKAQRRLVDFDDLLALALRDLRADRRYADAVRWRHRHLYIDEFQDVNPLQAELLKAWRGPSNDVFIVGDPNQAIYGWNGADPDLLNTLPRREPDAIVIRLDDNYRSTPQILAAASATLPADTPPLRAHLGDGPVPTITAHISDEAEAHGIAEAIHRAHTVGDRWSRQAVLVRTNAQLIIIEQALTAAGIPVRVRGGAGPLSSPEMKSRLRDLSRPTTDLAAALADIEAVSDPDHAEEEGSGGSVDPRLSGSRDHISESVRPNLNTAEIERRRNLAALGQCIRDYLAVDPAPTGPGFAAWMSTLTASELAADDDAVELATFHSAKGLEWPIVHLAGLEDGLVPIAYATTGAQRAEERRLLYVAMTRAGQQLHLSWAATRSMGRRMHKRRPSPYLAEITETLAVLSRQQQPLDWRTPIRQSREAVSQAGPKPVGLGSAVEARDGLIIDLRSWRMNRARAADVPPFVVLSDTALHEIVQRRPRSKSMLATITGIGATKLERYGDEMLDIIAKHHG